MTNWNWIPAGFACAALAVLAWQPAVVTRGFGEPVLPVVVHLLTAGVLLTSHYVVQSFRWRCVPGWHCPGRPRWVPSLAAGILALHACGVVLLGLGLLRGERDWAYIGGHYLLPTALVVSIGGDLVWHRRHVKGERPGLFPHLPGIGLLVAVPLGVLLVMDRFSGEYGAYSPAGILLHALAGAFLFVLPLQAVAREAAFPGSGSGRAVARLMVVAGLGLLAIGVERQGFNGGMPLGLLLLGAVALWVGLPLPREGSAPAGGTWRDAGWAVFGLLLLWGALQARRGAGVEVGYPLAGFTAVWFLLAEAVPRALLGVVLLPGVQAGARPAPRDPERLRALAGRTRRLCGAGAVLILAGQMAASEGAVRGGALVWLTAVVLLSLPQAGRVLRTAETRTP